MGGLMTKNETRQRTEEMERGEGAESDWSCKRLTEDIFCLSMAEN